MVAATAQQIFDRLWVEEYLPRYLEEQAATEQRRAEAFVDAPRMVAGFAIRPFTAYDFLLFEGYDSPYVVGNPHAATPEHLGWALWALRARPTSRWFPAFVRDRQILRWRRQWLDRLGKPTAAWFTAHAEFCAYIEDAFSDSGLPRTDKKSPPSTSLHATHWLAPLLVAVSTEMGPRDPIGDQPWAHVPLSQVFQYRRELYFKATGKPVADSSRAAELRKECLAAAEAEWKALTAAKSTPTPPAP